MNRGKNDFDEKVRCDYCGEALEEDRHFYAISLARVTQNDKDIWDYERDSDDSYICMKCCSKLPKPLS